MSTGNVKALVVHWLVNLEKLEAVYIYKFLSSNLMKGLI